MNEDEDDVGDLADDEEPGGLIRVSDVLANIEARSAAARPTPPATPVFADEASFAAAAAELRELAEAELSSDSPEAWSRGAETLRLLEQSTRPTHREGRIA